MTIATATAVAFVVFACKGKLATTAAIDLDSIPTQTADDIFIVQTENGVIQSRMEAGRMERYSNDSLTYDVFPDGLAVYAYTEDGLLETEITAKKALHKEWKDDRETWEAYGDVVIKNLINQEVMETDTIYWDRANERLYTHCYVEMYSPKGFMQGYGMESDQRARYSIIKRPFTSYAFVNQDTTQVLLDTANFIGPMLKKR